MKSAEQVECIRAAGLVVARTLALVRDHVAPGVTPRQLDTVAAEHIRSCDATPSFLGYLGFPASLCVSINAEVVHGIPDDRMLAEGDIVSVDCGAIVDGWHADSAITVPVGDVAPETTTLIQVTERALWHGLAAAVAGGRLSDISAAVEDCVDAHGEYGIVEEYCGHGIGRQLHQRPDVANYGRPGRGPRLRVGNVLAIEPMVTAGSARTRVLDNDWTVVTEDGLVSAHAEHTVAVTDQGPWVLTAEDGAVERQSSQ